MSTAACSGLLADFVLGRTTESFCDHCLILQVGASLREIRGAVSALVCTDRFRVETQTCARCLERSTVIVAAPPASAGA